ncbi:hypothetical protein BX661DRAFT_82263 [Kickxella alabastrina]|uniref:uncharacterized protein n=1 Tax=Kickxella alabastrina TaxID=61397 RepID=UPI00221FFF81|nr:uncharacterized protein BX661DRAFT_82263 [Kickxella alabastrina]KAI7833083.1 hypothetical protein BX661DRAFT_82263 [Kickxella alabastrina]
MRQWTASIRINKYMAADPTLTNQAVVPFPFRSFKEPPFVPVSQRFYREAVKREHASKHADNIGIHTIRQDSIKRTSPWPLTTHATLATIVFNLLLATLLRSTILFVLSQLHSATACPAKNTACRPFGYYIFLFPFVFVYIHLYNLNLHAGVCRSIHISFVPPSLSFLLPIITIFINSTLLN